MVSTTTHWNINAPFRFRCLHCVLVDNCSVHPSAIGGLSTDQHIISHDSRLNSRCPLQKRCTRWKFQVYTTTRFPNEILPRQLAVHDRVPIEVLCTETASVYVFADDRAYISKYAAAASEELRSVQVLLRRTALAHIHAAVERSSEIIITRATTFCFGCAKQIVLDL